LIQIIFWYVAVLQTLPPPRQSIQLPAGMLLNIRGLYLPAFSLAPHGAMLLATGLVLLVVAPFVRRIGAGRGLMAVLVLAGVALCVGAADLQRPVLRGFNIAGGTQLPPELAALWLGLSIYGAAFIAEIVRAAILAVPKGQREAALSVGLRPGQVMTHVVLPQALRVMVPPLTSQYLNIIKSSSLGAAVAYPELFQIFAGTVLNQSGRELETIAILMAIFLAISLLTSAFMNWYNRHVALVER
ncbi:MAG TPA: ABC transporter permease subunit, partial [Acetobacteraceae bacterium]|nr:ABC transporter permease subunit [Acetobacteraceae bacterium]